MDTFLVLRKFAFFVCKSYFAITCPDQFNLELYFFRKPKVAYDFIHVSAIVNNFQQSSRKMLCCQQIQLHIAVTDAFFFVVLMMNDCSIATVWGNVQEIAKL